MGSLKPFALVALTLAAPISMALVMLGFFDSPAVNSALDDLDGAVAEVAGLFGDGEQTTIGRPADTQPRTDASPDVAEEPPVVTMLYIGKTGGFGVSLRETCSDDARSSSAWADGTEVGVIEQGSAECAGWVLVKSGDTESWVRTRFLEAADPPAQFAAPDPPPDGTPTTER
jgi:hypothetical protein